MLVIAVLMLLPAPGVANHIVLAYHHVSDKTPAVTSVSPELFKEHLEIIAAAGFEVWPLGRLTASLRAGETIPDRVVALTFDDAYISVFENAYPMLAARRWPFTVFANTEAIDQGSRPYMTWDQLRTLVEAGVEVGNHSHSHAHLASLNDRCAVIDDIQTAQRRISQELGVSPTLFAYPYGEFTPELQAHIEDLKLTGVGQHSGALGPDTDWLAVPRFPMSGSYASPAEFRSRLMTRPLVVEADPSNGYVLQNGHTVELQLNIRSNGSNLGQLACYATGQGKMDMTGGNGRFTIRPVQPLKTGRTKFNCTAPSSTEAGVYHWWSYLVMKPNADGSWYGW